MPNAHTELKENEVIEKYRELKSMERTARFFQIGKDTLRKHLNAWGCEISFVGCSPNSANRVRTFSEPKIFEVGEIVIWKPVNSRTRCFGLPIATAPIAVRILHPRTQKGLYNIEVVDSAARIQLPKSKYTVHENALREVTK